MYLQYFFILCLTTMNNICIFLSVNAIYAFANNQQPKREGQMSSDVLCDAHDECIKYLNEFKSTYSIKNLGKAKRQKLVNCLEVMRQTRIMLDTTRDDWQEQIKLHK